MISSSTLQKMYALFRPSAASRFELLLFLRFLVVLLIRAPFFALGGRQHRNQLAMEINLRILG